jgi:hypothetical protein
MPNTPVESDSISRLGFNENQYFSMQFEKQIRRQKGNVLIGVCFMAGVFLIGLVSAWSVVSKGIAGTGVEYMKLGVVALSSLSLPYPLRMYLSYRLRGPLYEGYKRLFDEAAARGTEVNPKLVEDARKALEVIHKLD